METYIPSPEWLATRGFTRVPEREDAVVYGRPVADHTHQYVTVRPDGTIGLHHATITAPFGVSIPLLYVYSDEQLASLFNQVGW